MSRKPFTLIIITGILVLLVMGFWSSEISAKTAGQKDETISGVKVAEEIKIDGMLDNWLRLYRA